MFSKKRVETGIPKKIITRVRKLPTSDLVDWADQAIYTTGRCLTQFQRDRDLQFLYEAQTGAQVLLAITEEMTRREER